MPNNWQTVVVLGQLWWGFSIQMWVSLGWLIGIGLCPVSRSPVSMGLLLVCFQSPLSLTIGLHSGFPFCICQFWKPWYKFNSTLVSFMWIRGYVFFQGLVRLVSHFKVQDLFIYSAHPPILSDVHVTRLVLWANLKRRSKHIWLHGASLCPALAFWRHQLGKHFIVALISTCRTKTREIGNSERWNNACITEVQEDRKEISRKTSVHCSFWHVEVPHSETWEVEGTERYRRYIGTSSAQAQIMRFNRKGIKRQTYKQGARKKNPNANTIVTRSKGRT